MMMMEEIEIGSAEHKEQRAKSKGLVDSGRFGARSHGKGGLSVLGGRFHSGTWVHVVHTVVRCVVRKIRWIISN